MMKEKRKRNRDRVLQYAARTQKHYLWKYLCKLKELGIWHVVAWLQKINSMLPYFPLPSNSKLLEDDLAKIILWLIPMGWKCTMACANFKPLKYSMEELVEYLESKMLGKQESPQEE
eukprot:15333757-Ditylum_brightwellii.AAC.1